MSTTQHFDRRALLLGAGAAALAGSLSARPAFAQNVDFPAAAGYSAERRGVSLLVMKRGEIIYEDYPNAGGVDRAWELASGTKSFTGIMAAALADDGRLELNEPVADTIQEWRNDAQKRRITIRHLLTLTSGLDVRGAVRRPQPYLEAIEAGVEHPAGEVFEYGPTPFQVFGEVVRRKSPQDRDPQVYLQRRVLDHIGVAPESWVRGRDDMPFMPQGAHFTARAWARFGQWVMEGGHGLVDRRVLNACFQGTTANPGYGLSWWLLRPGLIPPNPRAGVGPLDSEVLGEDVRMAAGAGDQRLYLLPHRDVVIVRQANQIVRAMFARGERQWNDAEFLRYFAGL